MVRRTAFSVRALGSALIAAAIALQAPAMAGIEIAWEALVPPPAEQLQREVSGLQSALDSLDAGSRETFTRIDDVMSLRRRVAAGFIDLARLNPEQRAQYDQDFEKDEPDMLALWQRVQAAREAIAEAGSRVVDALDGKTVRMPGYVLPLDMEGSAVREFLLVPFVGACIHVPPPPVNQMVFVKTDEPWVSDGLYQAVWVEGVLSTDGGSHALSLVDGAADVRSGYSLQAQKITPQQR